MEFLKMPQGAPKSMEEAKRKSYQFWDTQPVPKLGGSFIHLSYPPKISVKK
jgi:hypothetical protein